MKKFFLTTKYWLCALIILSAGTVVAQKGDAYEMNVSGVKVIVQPSGNQIVEIQTIIKGLTHDYELNRGQKGYGAVISYLEQHNITHDYLGHVLTTVFIISALFSKNRFKERKLLTTYKDDINNELLHKLLEQLLSDKTFLNILLHP